MAFGYIEGAGCAVFACSVASGAALVFETLTPEMRGLFCGLFCLEVPVTTVLFFGLVAAVRKASNPSGKL